MVELKEYKTGSAGSYKLDDGILALVRKEKEATGLSIQYIIERAIVRDLTKSKTKK